MTRKRTYRLYQVDAFTRTPFAGNPAGVVPDADGLTADEMQAIARELNNSETAFLFRPEADDHAVHIRFFTPATEVPSCGHATIAAHYVRAREHNLAAQTVAHKIGIGVLPVEIVKKGDDYLIIMTQGTPEFLDVLTANMHDRVLRALHLAPSDLSDNAPLQIVSTGHSKLMIGVKRQSVLHSLSPDFAVLKRISADIGCNGYFVFTQDRVDDRVLSHCRMFAPAIGIGEDPVTGNGNGPLGAYLVKYGLVRHNGRSFAFKSMQGEAMRRPGMAHVEVEIAGGEPARVKVGGEAVIVFQTQIEVRK